MQIDNRIKTQSTFISFHIFINAFALFLYMFMPQYTLLTSLLILGSIFLLVIRNNDYYFKYNYSIIMLLIFLGVTIIGLLGNGSPTGDLQYVISISILIINHVILVSEGNWESGLITGIVIVGSIFLLGSLLQLFMPNLLSNINQMHLTAGHFQSFSGFLRTGSLAGFTHNTGVNGFILSILLIYCFLKAFFEKKHNKRIILYFIFIIIYYLLFLTGKRGFLIYTILILLYLIYRLHEKKFRIILPIIVILLIFYILITYTQPGQYLIERTMAQEDITTGRMPVYEALWEDFIDKPLFGNGTYSTINVISLYNGHNIYLQILREHGIVGFIPFIIVLISNVFKTDSLLKKSNINIEKIFLGFSMTLQLLFIFWGMTGNPLYDIFPWHTYLIGIAITWRIALHRQDEEKL